VDSGGPLLPHLPRRSVHGPGGLYRRHAHCRNPAPASGGSGYPAFSGRFPGPLFCHHRHVAGPALCAAQPARRAPRPGTPDPGQGRGGPGAGPTQAQQPGSGPAYRFPAGSGGGIRLCAPGFVPG